MIFLRDGAMWAVAFDPEGLVATGTAAPVLEGLATNGGTSAQLDVSEDGTLVYSAYQEAPERTLVWVNRQGREEPIPNVPPRAYTFARLSPDGRRIALDVRDQDNDILTWDLDRSVLTRVTLDRAVDRNPVWTLDGTIESRFRPIVPSPVAFSGRRLTAPAHPSACSRIGFRTYPWRSRATGD